MSEPIEIKITLVKARELIADPAHWIVGHEKATDPDTGVARWCAIGAVREAVGGYNGHRQDYDTATPYEDVIAFLNNVVYEEDIFFDDDDRAYEIVDVNDKHSEGHAMVMEMFDKAIARAAEQVMGGQ